MFFIKFKNFYLTNENQLVAYSHKKPPNNTKLFNTEAEAGAEALENETIYSHLELLEIKSTKNKPLTAPDINLKQQLLKI